MRFQGERGMTGDHGQDGRQGPRGERGPGPTQAEVDAEADRIEDVRAALAVALGEKQRRRDIEVDRHLRVIDRRVLVIAAFVLFGMLLFMFVDERAERRERAEDRSFQQKIAVVCEQNNTGHVRVNAALERRKIREMAEVATAEDKAAVAQEFNELVLPIADCPPR